MSDQIQIEPIENGFILRTTVFSDEGGMIGWAKHYGDINGVCAELRRRYQKTTHIGVVGDREARPNRDPDELPPGMP